jgi:hypothetical protein
MLPSGANQWGDVDWSEVESKCGGGEELELFNRKERSRGKSLAARDCLG